MYVAISAKMSVLEFMSYLKGKKGIWNCLLGLCMGEPFILPDFWYVVKWYSFIIGYEIGYIALLAPTAMLIVQYILRNRTQLVGIFTGIIIFLCVVEGSASIQYNKGYLQNGETRMKQYFAVRGLYYPYAEIAKSVKMKVIIAGARGSLSHLSRLTVISQLR